MSKSINMIGSLNKGTHTLGEAIGNLLVDSFHLLALFAIGGAIVWAAFFEFLSMIEFGSAKIEDILLLFIYLELGAMVGIYFKTKHMPLRFLIYVAMTALTRLLFSYISETKTAGYEILIVAFAILLLGITVLIIRYGSNRFPSLESVDPQGTD